MCEILSKISHRKKATAKNIFNAVVLPINIPVWNISPWRDKISIHQCNKTEIAKEISTYRAALDRLLNPYNDSVTLATLTKAANVLGKKLVLQLE